MCGDVCVYVHVRSLKSFVVSHVGLSNHSADGAALEHLMGRTRLSSPLSRPERSSSYSVPAIHLLLHPICASRNIHESTRPEVNRNNGQSGS
jgi:hypothetical protein